MYDNSTPFSHLAGPFLTSDGDLSTVLSITTDNLLISVNGSSLSPWNAGPSSPDADGYHTLTLTTIDLGANAAVIRLVINESSGAIMPWSTFFVIKNQNAYHGMHGSSNLDVNVVQVDNSGPSARALGDYFAAVTTVDATALSSRMVDWFNGTPLSTMPKVNVDLLVNSSDAAARLAAFASGLGSTVNSEDLSSQMVTYFNNFPFTELTYLTAFLTGLGSTGAAEDLSSQMVTFFGGGALTTLPQVQGAWATSADIDAVLAALPDSTLGITAGQNAFWENQTSGEAVSAGVGFINFWSNLTSADAINLSTLMPDFFNGVALSSLPQVTGAWPTTVETDTLLAAMLDTTNANWVTTPGVDTILAGQLATTNPNWATSVDIDTILAGQLETTDATWMATSDVGALFDDRGLTTAMPELATDPGNTPTPGNALMLLYHSLYHGQEASSVTRRIKNSGGSFLTGSLAFDGSTFDQGALSTP